MERKFIQQASDFARLKVKFFPQQNLTILSKNAVIPSQNHIPSQQSFYDPTRWPLGIEGFGNNDIGIENPNGRRLHYALFFLPDCANFRILVSRAHRGRARFGSPAAHAENPPLGAVTHVGSKILQECFF